MKDFELSVLKNLVTVPEYFTKAFGLLEAKYFDDPGTRGLFKLIKQYYTEYKEQPGILELATKIKDTSNAEVRKELATTIKELNSHQAEFKDLAFLLDETVSFVKDALYLEALTIGAEGLEKKSDELKQKAQAILDKRAQVHVDDNISLDFDDVDDIITHFSNKDVGLLTGHKELDTRLGSGFLPGTLNLIMAAQGVGKSLMMCDIATALLKQGKNVLIVSLEMSDYEMVKRIYANCLDVEVSTFLEMPDSEEAREKVRDCYNKKRLEGTLGKLFIKDYPAGSFSALMLEGLVERFRQEKGVKFDCIVVDYLGIMKSDLVSPSAGLYSHIKSIGEELRATAKKLGVVMVSASQLGRCFSTDSLLQTPDGLKRAGDIKQGDIVLSHDGWRTVKGVSKPEIKKAFKIKTKSGKELILSEDHPVVTECGIDDIRHGVLSGTKINVNIGIS